jgi:membrane protein YqaA with SNARE-associated domain
LLFARVALFGKMITATRFARPAVIILPPPLEVLLLVASSAVSRPTGFARLALFLSRVGSMENVFLGYSLRSSRPQKHLH